MRKICIKAKRKVLSNKTIISIRYCKTMNGLAHAKSIFLSGCTVPQYTPKWTIQFFVASIFFVCDDEIKFTGRFDDDDEDGDDYVIVYAFQVDDQRK